MKPALFTGRFGARWTILLAGTALAAALATPAFAQYPPTAGDPGADNTQGPVRLARFSVVDGNVTWRPDGNSDWQGAETNLPLNQGAQIWTDPSARGEIQFDDGTLLRLGPGALVTLSSLASDANGEYTQIQENSGLVTMEPTNDHSTYEIDTPLIQVKADGPARVRVGAGEVSYVAVRGGSAQIQGQAGQTSLNAGQFVVVPQNAYGYQVQGLPAPDEWDQWNDQRDQEIASANAAVPQGAMPTDIGMAAPGLSEYGDWQYAPDYGYVWHPHEYAGWRPYYAGHWVSVAPFGWTWVSAEPWGWAPYHYGSWVDAANGWCWVPGPRDQYWSPAVVHFTDYDGNVGWCPLAPQEVRYPSVFRVGVYGNSWSLFFSIGGCAVYLNDGSGICSPRPWDYGYLHEHRWDGSYAGFGPGHFGPGQFVDHPFVPRNQRFGGAVVTDAAHFQFAGSYRPAGRDSVTLFARGSGGSIADGFGPASVRPVAFAQTGAHPGSVPPQYVIQRHAFGAPAGGTTFTHIGGAGSSFTRNPVIHTTPGFSEVGNSPREGSFGGTHNSPPMLLNQERNNTTTRTVNDPRTNNASAFGPTTTTVRTPGFTGSSTPSTISRTASNPYSTTRSSDFGGGSSNYRLPQTVTPTYSRPTTSSPSEFGNSSSIGRSSGDSYHQNSAPSPTYSRPTSGLSSGFGSSSFGGTSSLGGRSSGTTAPSQEFRGGSSPSGSGSGHQSHSSSSHSSSSEPHRGSETSNFNTSNGGPNHGH